MSFMILLVIPVIIGLVCLLASTFLGQGRITWKEFFVHCIAMLLIMGAGWKLARDQRIADTEIWNGVIASKDAGFHGCCHSYECNCTNSCDSNGNNCTRICQTCYEHAHDRIWTATTSNGEQAFHSSCNPPSSHSPHRWDQIIVGEPTAIEHSFDNYIKGAPGSVLRLSGVSEEFKAKIPNYPRVYDLYRAHRFIPIGVQIPRLEQYNYKLSKINASLGKKKEVNIIVIVIDESNPQYLQALEEEWVGGKKNDVVVVIGTPNYPQLGWVGVMSWTTVEEIKINIRDRVMGLKTFDGSEILDIVNDEVNRGFIRREMAEFRYLLATIEPTPSLLYTLLLIAFVLSAGLQVYFYHADPFKDGERRLFSRYR